MNRQTSPLFLRVSIGLGIATAAITSTVRAEPWMLPDLHSGGGVASADQAPGARLPDQRAGFAFARDSSETSQASRSAFRHPRSQIPSRPIRPAARATVSPPASHPSAATGSGTTTAGESTPIFDATGADLADSTPATETETEAESTPLYEATSADRATRSTQPSDDNAEQNERTAEVQGASHRDGWRVAGHPSSSGSQRTPKHRAA